MERTIVLRRGLLLVGETAYTLITRPSPPNSEGIVVIDDLDPARALRRTITQLRIWGDPIVPGKGLTADDITALHAAGLTVVEAPA